MNLENLDFDNLNSFKRNPNKLKSIFKEIDNSFLVNEDILILFPERYINRNLVTFSNNVSLLGLYCNILEDKSYSITNVPAFIDIEPSKIIDISIDDINYKGLIIEKGTRYLLNKEVVKREQFIYDLFYELFIKANIPWYLDYKDIVRTLLYIKKYSGSNIGRSNVTSELFVSIITRLKDNKKIQYRYVEDKRKPYSFVGMESVFYSFNNTVNRLVGSYSDQGLTASLLDPSDNLEKIEKLLRS